MTQRPTRKTLLLISASVILLFFVGDSAYRRLLEEPLAADAKTMERLRKATRQAKLHIAKFKHANLELKQLENRSLPNNVEVARSEYQAWLLKIAEAAELENTHVDSSQPVPVSIADARRRPKQAFHKLTFSLRGRGELKHAVRLLHDFYRVGYLHKIQTFHLNPVGKQKLDISLSIQALALKSAQNATTLSEKTSDRLNHDNLEAYQSIVQRNLFGDDGYGEVARSVMLTAITANVQGVDEAWFTVGPEKETTILQAGNTLVHEALETRILVIYPSQVALDLNGETVFLTIGQTLADVVTVCSDVALKPQ